MTLVFDSEKVLLPSMSSSSKTTSGNNAPADAAFQKQTAAVREALQNFTAISKLNAPGPIKMAMEELVTITVRLFLFNLQNFLT